ncbi:MAG TPA: hypothetical protein VL588_05040 [Bdellovibrionota bacterium]|nr:hypothetical protein [Bdellovibrionota bacterium]
MHQLISWVRIYSEFTPEALFFEALGIFTLCALYSAYWVVAKRRLGVIRTAVPPGVVRTYLNQLIVDAEGLRSQMFGLLADHTAGAARVPAAGAGTVTMAGGAVDPEMIKKLAAVEQKLAEQNLSMSTLMTDKAKLESELASAKAKQGAAAAPAGATVDNGELDKLRKKIQELEERLSEYSVIEDDLANLKRLQQENAQLKAQLSVKAGGPAPAAAAAEPSGPALTEVDADGLAPEPSAAAAKPASAKEAAKGPADAFDGLVDEVEKSLGGAGAAAAALIQPPAGAAEPSAAAPAAGGEPAAAASPLENMGKGDEDLLAEFEKMLNS